MLASPDRQGWRAPSRCLPFSPEHEPARGTAAPGTRSDHEFDLDKDAVITVASTGDEIPPVISDHADVFVVPETRDGTPVTFDLPEATDDSGAVSVACSPSSGSLFPIGQTAVTCTATDEAGNSAQSDFDVTVGCCKAALRISHPTVQPGEEVALIARVRNLIRTPEALTLTFDINGSLIGSTTVTVSRRSRVNMPLVIGEDWPPGTYAIRMTVESAAGIFDRVTSLTVKPRRVKPRAANRQ